MSEHLPLITRYRPQTFSEVHGQAAAVILQRRLADPAPPHTYLFTGPSGVGKTTLARLVGHTLQAEISELDGASHSGVDEMRSLTQAYFGLRSDQRRMIIIDECHRLTRQAWDAALKTLEEPEDWLYFGLCTTELRLLPKTVVTRAYPVKLGLLANREVEELLVRVIIAEHWEQTVDPDVFGLVVVEANGSPRQALSLLEACYDAPDVATARQAIQTQGSIEPLQQVLQILLSGQGGWEHIRPMLAQIPDQDFSEATLVHACRYVMGWLNREQSADKAARQWELLVSLTHAVHGYDARSLFYTAIGRVLWGQKV